MNKKLINALLVANYVMNHDTDFVRIDVLANIGGFIFHEIEDVDYIRGQYGKYARRDILKAITAIGQNDSKAYMIYTVQATGDEGRILCISTYR